MVTGEFAELLLGLVSVDVVVAVVVKVTGPTVTGVNVVVQALEAPGARSLAADAGMQLELTFVASTGTLETLQVA